MVSSAWTKASAVGRPVAPDWSKVWVEREQPTVELVGPTSWGGGPARGRFAFSVLPLGRHPEAPDHADELLDQLADRLIDGEDPRWALQRLMREGFQRQDGERMQGLREMLEKLRQARQERLQQHDMGKVVDELREALDKIVAQERSTVERRLQEARGERSPQGLAGQQGEQGQDGQQGQQGEDGQQGQEGQSPFGQPSGQGQSGQQEQSGRSPQPGQQGQSQSGQQGQGQSPGSV